MSALDDLGGWKWPSIVAITLVPLGSYFLLDWGGRSDPVAEVILGPALIAECPVILSRPAAGPNHDWCVRSCPTCWGEVEEVALAYGTATGPREWTQATPSRDRLCASLDLPTPGATHIWVRVADPEEDVSALALDTAT